MRGASIGPRTGLELPSRRYVRDYGDLFDKTQTESLNNLEKYKKEKFDPRVQELKTKQLKISPLSMGMFNATLDIKTTVDIAEVLRAVLGRGLVEQGGIKCIKISTIYGKFSKAFETTKEYGDRVLKRVPPSKLTAIEFILRTGNKQGASFTIFKTGRIRFSGGYITGTENDVINILVFMNNNYFRIDPRHRYTVNNNTTGFELNMGINRAAIFHILDPVVTRGLARFGDYKISAEFHPERESSKAKKKTPFLYINFNGPQKFSLVCSARGTVMIEGTTEIKKSYDVSKKFFETLKNVDLLVPEESRKINNSPKNLKPTKIGRRMNNKPAPDLTRRGATCPIDKRPNPYSFQGKCPLPNHYVRPNPQGQPCCYRVPKRLGYISARVASRYAKAGVRVPENVRKLFNIRNNSSLPNNVSKNKPVIRTYINTKSGFKIDSRQCSRYTKVSLIDIAKRLGLNVPRVTTKPMLCQMIKDATQPAKKNKNNVSAGDNGLKLGGRYCMSYKKSTLVKYARALKVPRVSEDMSKEDICKMIAAKSSLNVRNRLISLSKSPKNVTNNTVRRVQKLINNAGPNANKDAIIKKYVKNSEKKLENLLNLVVM